MATKIKKMKWEEISGVDRPANDTPGWLLQKAAAEVEDFEGTIADFAKALESDSVELFFKDADEKTKKAVARLKKELDESLEEVEDEDEDKTETDEPVKKEKRGLAKLAELFALNKSEEDEDGSEEDEDENDEVEKPADETDESDEDEDEDDEDDEDEPVKKTATPPKKGKKPFGKKPQNGEDYDDEDDDDDANLSKAADDIVSQVVEAVNLQLDPIRDALGAALDRTENLEKAMTGRTSLLGQDGSDEDGDEDPDPRAGLHKAFTAVAKGARNGASLELT